MNKIDRTPKIGKINSIWDIEFKKDITEKCKGMSLAKGEEPFIFLIEGNAMGSSLFFFLERENTYEAIPNLYISRKY